MKPTPSGICCINGCGEELLDLKKKVGSHKVFRAWWDKRGWYVGDRVLTTSFSTKVEYTFVVCGLSDDCEKLLRYDDSDRTICSKDIKDCIPLPSWNDMRAFLVEEYGLGLHEHYDTIDGNIYIQFDDYDAYGVEDEEAIFKVGLEVLKE